MSFFGLMIHLCIPIRVICCMSLSIHHHLLCYHHRIRLHIWYHHHRFQHMHQQFVLRFRIFGFHNQERIVGIGRYHHRWYNCLYIFYILYLRFNQARILGHMGCSLSRNCFVRSMKHLSMLDIDWLQVLSKQRMFRDIFHICLLFRNILSCRHSLFRYILF